MNTMRHAGIRDCQPPLRFERYDDRYLVMSGDDCIGFVRKLADRWHWTDCYMRKSGHRRTRAEAAQACRKAFLEVQ